MLTARKTCFAEEVSTVFLILSSGGNTLASHVRSHSRRLGVYE